MSDSRGKRRGLRAIALAATLAAVGAPAGWLVSDRLEADNDFCTSCHLTPERPLHERIRSDFDRVPASNLAAVHALAQVETRSDSAFRCIDCHGGTGWLGKARVKALAGKDSFWYALGRFDEPDAMAWPLWDEDCRSCHRTYDPTPSPRWQTPRFHELPIHNAKLGVNCVECHRVHEAGGNPDAFFIAAEHVRPQCARCHAGFEDI